ncbi:MAG: biotin/lipoyl-binding protein [Saprospiraceae bacterium]|jgi:multidrug resistance efflux pump|nr:biotin/lipoyl-binding protein [Saprospiraceae bacterium]
MKNWNFFYWILFPLALGLLYWINSRMIARPGTMLGFAESKQADINLPYDVTVDTVFVRAGQSVQKGQALLRVSNREMEFQKKQGEVQKDLYNSKLKRGAQEVRQNILELQTEMNTKLAELRSKKQTIEAESGFFQSLVGGDPAFQLPEVSALEKEMEEVVQSYTRQMQAAETYALLPDENLSNKKLVDQEMSFIEETTDGFVIYAPFDGIVGAVPVASGEFREGYSILTTLVASTPTQVTGYINEREQLQFVAGDSVLVQAAYQVKESILGIIISRGNRIVEIPEKFSKIPGVKQYGIEVYLEIPPSNPFLQKEVLKIGVKP